MQASRVINAKWSVPQRYTRTHTARREGVESGESGGEEEEELDVEVVREKEEEEEAVVVVLVVLEDGVKPMLRKT